MEPTRRRTPRSERPNRARFESDLERQILDGTYADGAKLPSERELAEHSGLSRPVVREVLRTLVERGLIDVLPARGAFVKSPDSMHLADMMGSVARHQRATPRDLVEAREMIESRTAASAATRVDDADIAALREILNAFDKAPTTIDRARCDLAFHATIARLSGNPVLDVMFGAITPMVLELQLRSLADPVVLNTGAPLHHGVVDALAKRDATAAADAMTKHILLALDLYGSDLDAPIHALAEERMATILGPDARLDDIVEEVLETARKF